MARDTRGPSYTMHLDDTLKSSIYGAQIPNISFLYEVSTTKNPNYNVGDRVILGDQREFVYSKNKGSRILPNSEACSFTDAGQIAWTSGTAYDVGVSIITIPTPTHAAAFAVDYLRGGFVVIYQVGGEMFRGILGNDYSAINADVTIYLDAPTTAAIVDANAYEVFGNPYMYMDNETGLNPAINAFGGPPVVDVPATESYFWMQLKGVAHITPQPNMDGIGATGFMWKGDGSAQALATALGVTTQVDSSTQYAGFRIGGNQDGNGPIVYLQG